LSAIILPMVSSLRIFIFTFATFWFVTAGSLQADEPDSSSILGSYEGIVWSSGTLWPITTVFALTDSGELTGSYVYDENGGPFEGTLSRFRKTDERTCLLIWVEDSGSGTLEAIFNDDYSNFVGLWSPLDDGDAGYPWVGERMD
jgi:hypothetical protein